MSETSTVRVHRVEETSVSNLEIRGNNCFCLQVLSFNRLKRKWISTLKKWQ